MSARRVQQNLSGAPLFYREWISCSTRRLPGLGPAIALRAGRAGHAAAAAEPEVVVRVALDGHQLGGVPVLGAPAAVVFVGVLALEDEPAPLHLGGPGAAPAGELARGEREVHVLGGVAVLVVDAERA